MKASKMSGTFRSTSFKIARLYSLTVELQKTFQLFQVIFHVNELTTKTVTTQESDKKQANALGAL